MRPLRSRRPLAEEAADQIRDEILAGRLGQGERLVETRIAEALNISRGPVREAFKLLRAEGLVREERNRGTYVVSLSSADIHEIYDLRAAIESRAAGLRSQHATSCVPSTSPSAVTSWRPCSPQPINPNRSGVTRLTRPSSRRRPPARGR